MDVAKWLDTWGDLILRQYVLDVVKAFSKDPLMQERLLDEAWLSVDRIGPDKTTDCYMDTAFNAMLHYYKLMRRESRRWGLSAAYHRVRRARLRFYIRRKKILMMQAPMPHT